MARHFSWDCCWWSHHMAFWWGFTHGRGCWIGPSWILFGPQVWYSAWGIGPEAATTKSRPGKGSRSTSATGGLVLRGIGFTGLRSSDRQQWVGAMKPSFLRFLTSSFNYLFKPTMSTEIRPSDSHFFGVLVGSPVDGSPRTYPLKTWQWTILICRWSNDMKQKSKRCSTKNLRMNCCWLKSHHLECPWNFWIPAILVDWHPPVWSMTRM